MSSASSASARRRAAFATGLFAGAAVVSACRGVHDWSEAAPLALSYALLVANTYFSVRGLGPLVPAGERSQQLLDGLLVVLYLGLAASFGDVIRFLSLAALLFAIATLKYAGQLGRPGPTEQLARKVRVDTLGTIASVLALVAATAGYSRAAGWSLLGVNAVANLYVLWWRPLYR